MGEAVYGIFLVCISSFVPAVLVQLILNVRPWKTAVGVAALTSLVWIIAKFPLEQSEPGFIAIMFFLMAGLALPLSLAGAGLAHGIRVLLVRRHGVSDALPTRLED